MTGTRIISKYCSFVGNLKSFVEVSGVLGQTSYIVGEADRWPIKHEPMLVIAYGNSFTSLKVSFPYRVCVVIWRQAGSTVSLARSRSTVMNDNAPRWRRLSIDWMHNKSSRLMTFDMKCDARGVCCWWEFYIAHAQLTLFLDDFIDRRLRNTYLALQCATSFYRVYVMFVINSAHLQLVIVVLTRMSATISCGVILRFVDHGDTAPSSASVMFSLSARYPPYS